MTPAASLAIAMLFLAATLAFGGDDALDLAVRLAREALTRELPAATGEVVVVGVTAMNWPDASLGCPRPGFVYQAVVTPGHRVVLSRGGATYTVHVGAGHASVCGNPDRRDREAALEPGLNRTATAAPTEAALGLRLAEQARTDLAARLGLPRDRVSIDFYRRVSWPDAGLGCPPAAVKLDPQPTRGFRIQLTALGRPYEFHSDLSRLIECPVGGAAPGVR